MTIIEAVRVRGEDPVMVRMARAFAIRAYALLGTAAMILMCSLPCGASAQSALPVQWIYNPISFGQGVAYSPNGAIQAVCGQGGIQISTLATGVVQCLPTSATTVNSVAFSADGKTLIDGGFNYNPATGVGVGVVEVWNVATGALVESLGTSSTNVASVALSPDGSTLADGGGGVLELWSISSGKLAASIGTTANSGVFAVAFSPDGKTLADGGEAETAGGAFSGVIELWNIANLSNITQTTTLATAANNGVFSVAFSPDGTMLADGGEFQSALGVYNGVLELWALASNSVSTLSTSATYCVNSVAFSSNGTLLADGGSNAGSGVVELWNVGTLALTQTLPTASSSGVSSVAFSPNGSALADCGGNATNSLLENWSVPSGSLQSTSVTGGGNVQTVGFSPDGTLIAGGGGGFAGNLGSLLQIWNATAKTLTTLNTSANMGVNAVAFSIDGKTLASGGYSYTASTGGTTGILELWSVATSAAIRTLPTAASQSVEAIAYSPDGKYLAVGGIGTDSSGNGIGILELWDAVSGAKAASLATGATGGVMSVEFSPDSQTLAVGGVASGGVVELWNVSSGSLLKSLSTSIDGSVNAVAFSPDGATLADGGYTYDGVTDASTGMMELWSVPSGVLQATPSLVAGTSNVFTLSFAPSGYIVFAGTDLSLQAISPTSFSLLSYYTQSAANGVNSVATSPSGSELAFGAGTNVNGALVVAANPYFSVPSIQSVAVTPSSVVGGTGATGTVTLTGPALPGGIAVTLQSSNSSVVVPSNVTVLPGMTSVTFSVTTHAVPTAISASITGTLGSASATGTISVRPPTPSGLTISPASIIGGSAATGTVTLTGPAPTGGITVALSSSNPSAETPASVTVAAGLSAASFTIATRPVASSTPATLYATIGTVTTSATLTIAPPALTALTITPPSVVGGVSASGTVSLTGPAPTGGFVVSLSSNSLNAVPPSSVTVAAGSTSANFSIVTTSPVNSVTSTITATSGVVSKNATLMVVPLALYTLTLSPSTLAGGNPSVGTVALDGPAGIGGVKVALTSTQSAATVPASITIPAGQSSVTFSIATTVVTTVKVASITATWNKASEQAPLTITPPTLLSVALTPAVVAGGNSSAGTVTLTGPATPGGLVVKLKSSLTGATVPASVTIPAGKASAAFTVKTTVVVQQAKATITGTIGSTSSSADLTIDPPALSAVSVTPNSVIGSASATGTVTLSGSAPAGGMVVTLGSNVNSVSVPKTVAIPAGATHATFSVKTSAVAAPVTATVSAGLNGVTLKASLTVTPPAITSLTISPNSVLGGKSATGAVTISTPAPSGGLVIQLSSTSLDATIPATVTVPAGQTSAKFSVTTKTVTSSVTATIAATLGTTTLTTKLKITS